MKIRNILKKSWIYLFFVIVVTILMAGGISLILSVEEQFEKAIKENTYQISIVQKSAQISATNEDLLYWLEGRDEEFVMYKDSLNDRLIFSNKWQEAPYNLKDNQIYINRWNAKDRIIKDGSPYYYFMGLEYEVAGYINEYINVIADIVPVLERNNKASMNGIYYIEAKENTEEMVIELQNYLYNKDISFSYEKVQSNFIEKIFNQAYAVMIFGGCGLLLFIGAFTIHSSWADSHIREMFVRRLVGAGELQLMFRLYIEMLGIRIAGMVIGLIIVYIITNLLNVLPDKTVLKIESVYTCVWIFLIMDILYTFPMILIRQKKKLVQIMR